MLQLTNRPWIRSAAFLAGVLPAVLAGSPGEGIYQKGILPSGEPVQVAMLGGSPVVGSAFSCASCHTRSGLGTMAEGARPLPVNGANLFKPLYPYYPTLSAEERATLLPARFQTEPWRPPYTEATLARAIREGIDPTGRVLDASMPRFLLSDRDTGILIRYLENLSARPDPGVSETTLALATVITDEVPAADREAMLRALERSVLANNNLGPKAQGSMGSMLGMREMSLGYRKRTLARWLLKGDPETWPGQLEAYDRQAPVFALVGGISTRPWDPVHRFCESHRIPCLFPLTDLPALADSDFYTVYFSKGFHLEGQAAALDLEGRLDSARPMNVLQILAPGPEAAALAAGFQAAWSGAGHGAVETRVRKDPSPLPANFLAKLGGPAGYAAVLLWTGPEAYPALEHRTDTPPLVVMSSTLLGGALWKLPLPARATTFITFPYRKPGPTQVVPKMGGRPYVVDKPFKANDRRIASRSTTMVEIVDAALGRMERNFYRDHLLDLVGMMEDKGNSDYEMLTFGPDLRYVSEGFSMVQLTQDPGPVLQPASWK